MVVIDITWLLRPSLFKGFSGQVVRGDGKSEISVRHTNLVNFRTR
ncbi:unnamed protein product [Diplocarpon coronariae]